MLKKQKRRKLSVPTSSARNLLCALLLYVLASVWEHIKRVMPVLLHRRHHLSSLKRSLTMLLSVQGYLCLCYMVFEYATYVTKYTSAAYTALRPGFGFAGP